MVLVVVLIVFVITFAVTGVFIGAVFADAGEFTVASPHHDR